MKLPSSPGELTGRDGVREVLGQGGMDLVYRADETVVRRGNDARGAIDGRAVAGLFDLHPGESHFERALRPAQGKGDLVNSISARAHLHEEQGSYNDALNDWEILRTMYSRYPDLTFEVRTLGEKARPANRHRIQNAAR